MSDGIFDQTVAPTYDAHHATMFDPSVLGPTIDVLAELAAGGRALELASGTGRVALPLSERGVEVAGIELSQAMIDQMLAKPGADRVPVTRGDMTSTTVEGSFTLVYLVFNTIGNLLTQDEQVECFRKASAHLSEGGSFVVELGVPGLRRLPPGEHLIPFALTDEHVGIDDYDVVNQRLVSHHTRLESGGVSVFKTPQRYVWPSELDLMARLAGLELDQRWASWHRDPFTADSTSHVSVWRKR